MHSPKCFMFVNDGSHFTLSGAKPKTIWVTLAMSGIDEDFDLFATPIHEYCRPSIASGITPVAPPRASGSWARPSDAECSQPPSGNAGFDRSTRCGFSLRGG